MMPLSFDELHIVQKQEWLLYVIGTQIAFGFAHLTANLMEHDLILTPGVILSE
jgi:hypothetical protein